MRLSRTLHGFAGLASLGIEYEQADGSSWRGNAHFLVRVSHMSEVDVAWLEQLANALEAGLAPVAADITSLKFAIGSSGEQDDSDALHQRTLTVDDFTALADEITGESCVLTPSWAFDFRGEWVQVAPRGDPKACA